MKLCKLMIKLTIMSALIVFDSSSTNAADLAIEDTPIPAEAPAPDRNGFSITPYFWMTYYHGTMTVDGQTIDMSGTSVFDLLDAGDLRFLPLVAQMEWDAGQWGAYFDGTLIGIEFGQSDISLGSGPLTAQFGLDFTYALVNTGLTYSLFEGDVNGFYNELDLMPGIRWTYYDLDLAGSIGAGNLSAPISLEETPHWVDGTLGLRMRGQNAANVTHSLYGDVGIGEGVSAQALATIGKTWKYSSFDFNFFGGYRYLYQDWSSGNDAVDLTTHGPLIGMKFIF